MASNEEEHLFAEAKAAELDSWRSFGVFEEIDQQQQQAIAHEASLVECKWVLTWKIKNNNNISGDRVAKARLVARGFQDGWLPESSKSSPTCDRGVLLLLLALVPTLRWKLHSLDVKTAFLQSDDFSKKRKVVVVPPVEAKTENLWLLKKCVYGLADAPLEWYKTVASNLNQLGLLKSSFDQSLFLKFNNNNKLEGFIVIHVDDFLYSGTADFHKNVIAELTRKFIIGSRSEKSFEYLGSRISQDDVDVVVDQDSYLKVLRQSLEEEDVDFNDVDVDLENYSRKMLGKLQWLAVASRPDMLCKISILLQNNSANIGSKPVAFAVKKLFRQVFAHDSFIRFSPLAGPLIDVSSVTPILFVFADSSWHNLKNGKSQQGHLIGLGILRSPLSVDDENPVDVAFDVLNIFTWSSRKSQRVCRSSLTAELSAACDAIERAKIFLKIVEDLRLFKKVRFVLFSDAKNVISRLDNNNNNIKLLKDKTAVLNYAYLREAREMDELEIVFVKSQNQLADVLTKERASPVPLLNALKA